MASAMAVSHARGTGPAPRTGRGFSVAHAFTTNVAWRWMSAAGLATWVAPHQPTADKWNWTVPGA